MTLTCRTLLFSSYCLAVALIGSRLVRELVEYSRLNVTASHIVLVPAVTCWLLVLSRRRIFATVRTAPIAGAAFILTGTGLLFTAAGPGGVAALDLSLSGLALAVLWIGGFLFFYGWNALGAALFPLMFLAFMIPLPEQILNPIIAFLKAGSTAVVAALFSLTGTLYHREGFVFSLGAVTIEVADECSGIRSSIALFLASLLAGHLFLRTAWKKLLLVTLVVPLTIVKNAIRIAGLTLLAIHVDPGFLTGQLHHEGGMVFFLMALALVSPVFLLLRRSDLQQNRRRLEPSAAAAAPAGPADVAGA